MQPEPDPIDAFLQRARARLEADAAWSDELRSSQREFFPSGRTAPLDEAARRRHLEWFLFERTDARGPELAIERALATVLAADPARDADWMSHLRESHAGVFEVTGVQPGEGVWLFDLGGRGEFPVADVDASNVLATGDVIAGRLFALPGGVHRMSPSAAFHRDERLAEALRADFERARAERRGVLRVGQREIEAMFFDAPRRDDAVAEARALLLAAGIESERIDAWIEELESAPFDEDRLVHGAQDALSEILDELAFESAVDLDAARRALLGAWAQLARRGPGEGPSLVPRTAPTRATAPSTDVALAVARFEERRQAGEPLARILDDLERELALEEPADAEADASEPSPDFPGVVSAMVEEFLWETSSRDGQAAAARHENLRGLGRSAESIGVFENLRARDLLVYAAVWLPEHGDLGGSDDARARLASLGAFCRWAESEHEVPLHREFQETLARLGASLPRVAEANQRRTRRARPEEGEIHEVMTLEGEEVRVRGRSGVERSTRVDPDLARWLAPGDRIRGTLHADGRLAAYACFPPEVADLGV